MNKFILKTDKNNIYEIGLLIDGKIFNQVIVLKACYELIEKAYFFIEKQKTNFYVYIKSKNKKDKSKDLVNLLSQELIYHRLREQIEKQTKSNRQKIIDLAIGFSNEIPDIRGEIQSLENQLIQKGIIVNPNNQQTNSIENIISDINNDPDLQDDKDEIINVLKEIQQEN